MAQAQHGVFSRQQARDAGYTDRQIDLAVGRGDWVKVASAVFGVAGAPTQFFARAWTAVLAAGDGAMLARRVAGQLHKLDGVPASGYLDLYVPTPRRPRNIPGARVHRFDAGTPTRNLGLPTAPLPLTVVDLARELPLQLATRIVADAVRTRRVDLPTLERELQRARGRRNVERAREAVRLADPRLESILEDELFAVVRPTGIEVVPQYEVIVDGRFVARVDLGIPELRLALEADGYGTHALRPGFERDRERGALLQLAGWSSLAFTAMQIRQRPDWVRAVIWRRVAQRRRELGLPE
jgi:very-short-patch-repair endonuclease